ncbi:phenylacyl-CoA dehydrogenase [Maricurvus nonylphenolicus]|uniref:acyl-CoA dehydrogenase C-terminal domain-containing protein n=1 Tax=Maricurvus nonylphenolicus TaxID=1008307 RepID=UPI0036F3C8DF
MAEYKVPVRDIEFAFHDVLDLTAHYQQLPGAEEVDRDFIGAVMTEAAKFSEDVLAPLNQSGDQQGCQWNDTVVTTPDGFKDAYQQFVDNGWPALAQDVEKGGQGLPMSLQMSVYEMLISANLAWGLYPTITWGAVTTIEAHGTDEQKRLFLPEMIAGRWTGTMCLTESHCGSDLGLLRTKAEPNADGSYNITGNKIFISSGEHDMADNIVHVTLARLPDAPAGTKGISLFLVPKFHINGDGSIGERNSVSCGSIEHKMGIHGNATCVINFDNAKGYLIGPENRGLNCMFTFINESRVDVCLQAHGQIERSYQGALSYARERLQMKAIPRVDKEKPADPIIAHPEIRRLLLTQRSFSEGARLMAYDLARLVDLVRSGSEEEKHQAEAALGFLTPIAKGFITEAAIEATSHGVQVYGGHGFIQEWGMEQLSRDVRITAIYEGTTAIQGLDLITRKILADDQVQYQRYLTEIKQFCATNKAELDSLMDTYLQYLATWEQTTARVLEASLKDLNEANAAAVDFLMLSGYVVMGYYLVRAAVTAKANLADDNDGYYQSKMDNAVFFVSKIMPRIHGLQKQIEAGTECYMTLAGKDFDLASE